MAEGIEEIGVVEYPLNNILGLLVPPRFLWKEESMLIAPPPLSSGMAVGAVLFEHFAPHVRGCRGKGCEG